jgi:acetolactate decarboxylase
VAGNRERVLTVAALVLIAAVLVAAFYEVTLSGPGVNSANPQNTLYQVTQFNTFSAGNFGGVITYAQLAEHGDFGIGTLTGLNGEMIALNGVFYQISANGVPRQISPSEETPYATVVFFEANRTMQLPQTENYTELAATINATLPDHNAIYAVKVHGYFDYAKTRAPQLQTVPYPNLTDALKNQSVFALNSTQATLVGFYFPNSMDGIDYAGYHLHLITDDKTAGGHLLECTLRNATVEIDQINNYQLLIP